MNTIILHKEDMAKIEAWFKSECKSVNPNNCPFSEVELVFEETKDKYMKYKCYRKEGYVNIYISVDGISKGRLRVDFDGKLLQNKLVYNLDEKYLKSMYLSYFVIMEYIAKFKPENTLEVKEQKQIESKHKNSKKRVTSTTYLFHHFRGGSHSKGYTKPSHAFSVRGHYRHLKNGKTVWVKEYVKGEGKPKERTYRF